MRWGIRGLDLASGIEGSSNGTDLEITGASDA